MMMKVGLAGFVFTTALFFILKNYLIEANSEIVSQTLSLLKEGDILITMGAGNIWQYGEEILRELKNYVDTNHNN